MTKVTINPGICNLITSVEAESPDKMNVTVNVKSGCDAVNQMFKELGNNFDAYEICLTKPGCGAFYEYASEKFPVHCGCPVISGIIKCIEAECNLALPKNCEIKFI